jgi:subtilisin-like proprotein convertase family protein
VDIYSASWGPTDDGKRLEGPGHLSLETLEAVVNGHKLHPHLHGRGGKGAIYVWAGGNGRAAGDNCNYDGWANSRFTITIAAVTDNGQQPFYSESCSALMATAPSSGGRRSITTSDLLGAAGQDRGDCTHVFGGTSAAAPMVAGVVGLVLQANPELGWRDVQHIFVHTSRPISNFPGHRNNAGLYHSHQFGFGLVNATAAVLEAEDYKARQYTSPPALVTEYYQSVGKAIPDGDASGRIPDQLTAGISQSIWVSENFVIEHVEVVFDADHARRGELELLLLGPEGSSGRTPSQLAEAHGDPGKNYDNWKMMSVAYWNERAPGEWTLTVKDNRRNNNGLWKSWRLRIWGTEQ